MHAHTISSSYPLHTFPRTPSPLNLVSFVCLVMFKNQGIVCCPCPPGCSAIANWLSLRCHHLLMAPQQAVRALELRPFLFHAGIVTVLLVLVQETTVGVIPECRCPVMSRRHYFTPECRQSFSVPTNCSQISCSCFSNNWLEKQSIIQIQIINAWSIDSSGLLLVSSYIKINPYF